MIIAILICAASAALTAAAAQPASSPAPPKVAVEPQAETYFQSDAELTAMLRDLVAKGEAKGLVLGLIEPDGRRRVIAFGNAGEGTAPLSSGTVFETGSIAKVLTGAILADMVRRGEVSLSDRLAKFLPADVKVPSRNGRHITLLDLATHTSGLPRSLNVERIRDFSNPYSGIPITERTWVSRNRPSKRQSGIHTARAMRWSSRETARRWAGITGCVASGQSSTRAGRPQALPAPSASIRQRVPGR